MCAEVIYAISSVLGLDLTSGAACGALDPLRMVMISRLVSDLSSV